MKLNSYKVDTFIDSLKTTSSLYGDIKDYCFILAHDEKLVWASGNLHNLIRSKGKGQKALLTYLFLELNLRDIFKTKNTDSLSYRKINIFDKTMLMNALLLNEGMLAIILRDISDQREMANDISKYLQENFLYKLALNSLDCLSFIADPFDNIVFINNYAQKRLAKIIATPQKLTLSYLQKYLNIIDSLTADSNGGTKQIFLDEDKTNYPILIKNTLWSNTKVLGYFIHSPFQYSEETIKADTQTKIVLHITKPTADAHAEDITTQEAQVVHEQSYTLHHFVGQSKSIIRIKEIVRKVALSSSTVLLQSDSGTGKEILAHSLHELGSRANGPFVKLNCASVPGSLLESEMFGYEPGAFTGAKKGGNPGRFEQAHGGTIFLDEIGEMPLSLQAMLLRVIQEKEIQRLGGIGSKKLDVRIICATNKDLLALVKSGLFRNDLFYRLNVVSINIPSLKERKEDIKSLVLHFLQEYSSTFRKKVHGISKEVYYLFMNYNWPGNIRELKNCIEYAFNLIDQDTIEIRHLPQYLLDSANKQEPNNGKLSAMLQQYKVRTILNAIQQYNGNKKEAAKSLGISRSNMYKILDSNAKQPASESIPT